MFNYAFLLFLFVSSSLTALAPLSVYLSWNQHPDTTMVIRWITPNDNHDDVIYYGAVKGEEKLKKASGIHFAMPDGHPYIIHYLELSSLEADTLYYFKIGEDDTSYKFRTMPSTLSSPIRFVVGGDMYHDSLTPLIEIQQQAAATTPHFALLGGDIAYTAPKFPIFSENFERWLDWLTTWSATMVTPEGCLIPMVVAIGNHDVIGRYSQPASRAAFFYALFITPDTSSYKVIDFDHYMSVIVLDTNHTNTIAGEQKTWLHLTLEQRPSIPNKFAIYHVPAYPAIRSPKGPVNSEVRQHWVPLFDQFRLTAAFENHDHAYKRTHLLYNGQPDAKKGVLYLGDGAWGVEKPRKEKFSKRLSYLANVVSSRHFILVTVYPNHETQYQAINDEGKVFDSYRRSTQ